MNTEHPRGHRRFDILGAAFRSSGHYLEQGVAPPEDGRSDAVLFLREEQT